MARPRASPNRTQSPLAPRDAQRGHAALPSRCHCSLHQQPSRTRRAHDEAPSKNLRRLSLVGRCNGLRPHPLLLLDRKEAGLEHHRRSHPPPIALGQIPTSCLSHPANLGSNLIFCYFLRYFSSTRRTDLSRFRGPFIVSILL